MARTVDAIKADIRVKIRTYPALDIFKFPDEGGSKVDPFNLLIDVVSLCMFTFEVLVDQLLAVLRAAAAKAIAGNNAWIRDQMLKFQYGDVINMVNFVPTYPVVDETKRIITQCAVKDAGSGVVAIKIAKGSAPPFTPLTSPELIAAKNYYYGTSTAQGIGFSGVKAAFITLDPDRMMVEAQIYFQGQYIQATVKSNVIAAINTFLQSFTNEAFDGRVFMIRLVDAVQAVPGVTRCRLTSVRVRPASVSYASGTVIDIQGVYDTIAGHIISEDESGHTLADSITMLQEV